MAKINLLPWRDELREQKKKQFIAICIGVALIGLVTALLTWFYFDHKLEDQEQANQLVTSTNQNLDTQLKSLEGLQERRNAIIERMKLIQGLQLFVWSMNWYVSFQRKCILRNSCVWGINLPLKVKQKVQILLQSYCAVWKHLNGIVMHL